MGIKDYITDLWNINDIMSIIITLIYVTLRLRTDTLRVNFIPIQRFEFVDWHLETEIALDML